MSKNYRYSVKITLNRLEPFPGITISDISINHLSINFRSRDPLRKRDNSCQETSRLEISWITNYLYNLDNQQETCVYRSSLTTFSCPKIDLLQEGSTKKHWNSWHSFLRYRYRLPFLKYLDGIFFKYYLVQGIILCRIYGNYLYERKMTTFSLMISKYIQLFWTIYTSCY